MTFLNHSLGAQGVRRVGLSRLDVVVILVILLIVLGLVVVILSRQRGLGQRVQCMNHLKVIGEGVQAFHETHGGKGAGFLPPARIADGYATWAVLIAPYITADRPLSRWDVPQPFLAQPDEVRRTPVPLYFCPARPRTVYVDEGGALGDYAGAAGNGAEGRDWTGATANGAIILGDVVERDGDRIVRWRGRVSFADLRRGLSNTLLIGEKHVPSMAFGQVQFGDGSIYDGRFPASCSRVGGPEHPLAQSPVEPFRHNFGSVHVGLCHFVAADGSVRAVNNDISPALLGRLIAIADE